MKLRRVEMERRGGESAELRCGDGTGDGEDEGEGAGRPQAAALGAFGLELLRAGGEGGEDFAVEGGIDGEGKISEAGDGAVGCVEILPACGAGGKVLAEGLAI